ncbi:MAG: caspase family protein [Chitinophagaceae bacterium]
MEENHPVHFTKELNNFKEKIEELKASEKNRLVLIIMANTLDPALSTGCAKDAKAVRNTFKKICSETDYNFCCIEISDINYSRENLLKAIDSIGLYNDVTVFYYSGHGFSYAKDSKSKYPQIDMRRHNSRADFSKIDFIEKHTENLAVVLNLMRFKGGRINIALADCCNTTIPFFRKKDGIKEMNVVDGIMPPVSKVLTKKLFTDFNNAVSILVSSSVQGQPAISDSAIGSIFTYCFTETIKTVLAKELKTNNYFPWLKVLKATSAKAFNDSKNYDIGNGIAGEQKAVFEVFIDKE